MNLRVSFHKAPNPLDFGLIPATFESATHIERLVKKIKD